MTLTNSTVTSNSTTQDWADGGGIYNSGTVTFDNSIVSDNSTSGFFSLAGGIYNSGTVTLTNSTLSDNSTTGDDATGGGIYNDAHSTLILTASTVEGNSIAGTLAFGAGIYVLDSTAILTNSTVDGNRITGFNENAGGLDIQLGSTVSLNHSTVTNNYGGSAGGGILNHGTLTLADSTVSDNSTVVHGTFENSGGGGIYNDGSATLINSSVSDNSTIGYYSSGGGICNTTGGLGSLGTMTLIDSTVSGNSNAGHQAEGGGIYNGGTLTLIDCTVAVNNTVGTGPPGGGIYNEAGAPGGGIYNEGGGDLIGILKLTDTTVSGNTLPGSGPTAAASQTATARYSVLASIIAGNSAPVGPDGSGQFNSQGYNLIGNTEGSTGWGANDLLNIDPMLGPLQDNGGPTMTMALLPGSPAIDAGIPVQGITTDQCGVPRTQGPEPDIGAYEFQYLTAFDLLASPTITYGTAAVTLTGQITAGTQTPTGSVAITLNGTTQSAAIDPSTGKFSAVFTHPRCTSLPHPIASPTVMPGVTASMRRPRSGACG